MVDNQEMNFRVFSASTVPLARPGLRSAGRLLRSGLVTGTALVFLFAASTHLAAQEVAEPVRLVPVVAAIQETRAAEVTTLDVDWFDSVRQRAVPVRVYVPYGRGWWPYAVDKALARPHLLGWMIRDRLGLADPPGYSPA